MASKVEGYLASDGSFHLNGIDAEYHDIVLSFAETYSTSIYVDPSWQLKKLLEFIIHHRAIINNLTALALVKYDHEHADADAAELEELQNGARLPEPRVAETPTEIQTKRTPDTKRSGRLGTAGANPESANEDI